MAVALLLLILALLAGTVPSLIGYESFVVFSGSMEPAIHVGDLAIVAPAKPVDLKVGDIVTYRLTDRPGVLVTHRIVQIGLDDKHNMIFTTKGDANNSADQVQVDQGAVLGRVAFSIPQVGYLVDFAKRPEGRVLLLGIPGLLLALDYLLGLRRRRKGVVSPARDESGELIARGRLALENGGVNAAVGLFDQAIGLNPRLEEAWLLKAQCLSDAQERLACLRVGLTINPGSSKLKQAIEQEQATIEAAAG
jgi:signal peptidase